MFKIGDWVEFEDFMGYNIGVIEGIREGVDCRIATFNHPDLTGSVVCYNVPLKGLRSFDELTDRHRMISRRYQP